MERNATLYFSHLQGENYFIKSKDEYKQAILKNPSAKMIFIDDDKITFYNDQVMENKELILNDTSGDVIAVEADRKDLLIGNYGKKVIAIGVKSPALLSNYPFWRATVELSPDFYVLPNGKVFEDHRRVKNWIKKYGTDKLEFNRKSFEEASKLAKYTSKGIIKTIEKPKSKPDNPFFDPKVVKSHEKVDKSVISKRKNAISAKNSVKDSLLTCNNCPYMGKCPKFQANAVCAYSKRFKELAPLVKTRDIDLLSESLQKIMEVESKRYLRGATMEEISGNIDRDVTSIGDGLFNKIKSFMDIMKPVLNNATQYNILNQNVNVAVSVEKLENAGLSEDQRRDLAKEIEGIIKEQKRKATS